MIARALAVLLLCALAVGAQQPRALIWHDPGDISRIDLGGDDGTGIPAPKPPFTFLKEDGSGTQPKVLVKDAAGRTWDAKFGYEVKPECFAWRIPAAVGYYIEPSYYVASGQFRGMTPLKRKTPSVQADGRFKDARFQARDATFRYVDHETWKWIANPFAGTKELKGLEILIMLASNWDNKDGTSGPGDSNTGMFERVVNGRKVHLYSFTDWGSGMGAWGDATGQTDWNCRDYTAQTTQFVKGVVKGQVVFGYEGHHNQDFKTNIRPADVAWLMKYLGQISDSQIRAALKASGATAQDEDCFVKAIRARIDQLASAAKLAGK
jgi:hypothetical protein